MPARKFKSADFPDDNFVETTVLDGGNLDIEIAMRWTGQRNFDRLRIRLSPDTARKLLDRVAKDMAQAANDRAEPPQ
jgi:adenylate kinase